MGSLMKHHTTRTHTRGPHRRRGGRAEAKRDFDERVAGTGKGDGAGRSEKCIR